MQLELDVTTWQSKVFPHGTFQVSFQYLMLASKELLTTNSTQIGTFSNRATNR
jgi:hypothetical protein